MIAYAKSLNVLGFVYIMKWRLGLNILFKASGEAVRADPLQLVTQMRWNDPQPDIRISAIHPLMSAPECPIDRNKVGGSATRTRRWRRRR